MTLPTRTLALAILALSPVVALAEEPAATSTLADEVQAAYAATQQYQADVTFTFHMTQPRTSNTQTMDWKVAFDRSSGRLVIDKPDMLVHAGGGHLQMQTEQLPGAHLDVAVNDPATWSDITTELPMIASPPLADVIFLTDGDPQATLAQMGGALVADDAKSQLHVDTQEGRMTFHIDPQSHLISKVVLTIDPGQVPPNSNATLTLDYTMQSHNEAIDEAVFAFDTTNSTAAASIDEMVQHAQGGGGGGGGGHAGGGGGGHMLDGQEAPAIDSTLASGDAFKLEDVEADVVVLDFWATWCPPCREGLPHIQAVADWAQAEGKSVAVYTVNVGETADVANNYWKEAGFTMPIVMDESGQISQTYGAQGIPQTVVIHQGQVVNVHVGLAPNLEETLKSEIDAALASE